MRWLALFPLGFALGCLPGYSSHAVNAHPDVDARSFQNLGCLEVAFGLRPPAHDTDAAVLITRFGNTCLHPTAFDLRGIAFSGVDREGHVLPLSIVDPRAEVHLLHVDAAARGIEKVRLRAAAPLELTAICLNVAGISPGSSHPPGPPFCFRPSGEYWEVRP